jgi:hypothetical protein
MPVACRCPHAHGKQIEFAKSVGSCADAILLAGSGALNFHDVGAALHHGLSGFPPLSFHLAFLLPEFSQEDAKAKKMLFVKSVDIRGNTDESWQRGLDYLLRHYLLNK